MVVQLISKTSWITSKHFLQPNANAEISYLSLLSADMGEYQNEENSDNYLKIDDFLEIWKPFSKKHHLILIADNCHSGFWVENAEKFGPNSLPVIVSLCKKDEPAYAKIGVMFLTELISGKDFIKPLLKEKGQKMQNPNFWMGFQFFVKNC